MSDLARVTIRYVLVGFRPPGSADDSRPRRTREEAEARARTVFERAKSGEEFGGLVREFSDAQRGPSPAAQRRIEELYCRAMKVDSLDQLRDDPDATHNLSLIDRHLRSLLEYGSDFDSIRAALEERKSHIIITKEFRDKMNRLHPGLIGPEDSLFPESLSEIVWLTRDRKVFDDLLRLCAVQEIDDTFTLANDGVPAAPGQIPRSQTMKPWADVAFGLAPEEVGFVVPDATCSPDFAVVKRVE